MYLDQLKDWMNLNTHVSCSFPIIENVGRLPAYWLFFLFQGMDLHDDESIFIERHFSIVFCWVSCSTSLATIATQVQKLLAQSIKYKSYIQYQVAFALVLPEHL